MVELTRAHTVLRRVIGRGLALLADRNEFMKLGYATLGSYVDQALGIGARHAQDLAWVERELRDRPATAAAYERGELTFSATRLLLQNIPAKHEGALADLSRGSTVQEVRALIEAFQAMIESTESVGRRIAIRE
jgi:hypothetical protein